MANKTFDLTPSWKAASEIIALGLTNGTDEGKKMARENLNHMAQVATGANELLTALKDLAKEINLSKLNVRNDFSLINAHAQALKTIEKYKQ